MKLENIKEGSVFKQIPQEIYQVFSLVAVDKLMDEVSNDVVISLHENDDYPTIIIYDGYLE